MGFAVIIPAYNEAKTIQNVVSTAVSTPGAEQVIVVDDGSEDDTAKAAASAGAKVLRLESNEGKASAMLRGAEQTACETLVFLDADLIGLRREHILALAGPVEAGEADMTIGLFESGRLATDFAQTVAPFLSGQRAVKRWVLLGVSDIGAVKFGIEVALTRYAREAGLRVKEVRLAGLTHVMKEEKLGLVRGAQARLKMYLDILRTAQRG
ncbi:MAG TPA: glycosyltransferase family 2 protein [Firmicutes bacterium]|nr:glycosyltransferase family 2 protein [Bacillota bacterium]